MWWYVEPFLRCWAPGVLQFCSWHLFFFPFFLSSIPQITAVCNFFTYIRYIQQGLVRQDGKRGWQLGAVGPLMGQWEKFWGRTQHDRSVASLGYPELWEIVKCQRRDESRRNGFTHSLLNSFLEAVSWGRASKGVICWALQHICFPQFRGELCQAALKA